MPLMNSTGINAATSEIVMETIVKPISWAPLNRSFVRLLALFHMAHDIFEHDDGVVDDEANGQSQRHQRQIVEAVIQAGT